MAVLKRFRDLSPYIGDTIKYDDILAVSTLTATDEYGLFGASGYQIAQLSIDLVTDQSLYTFSDVKFNSVSSSAVSADVIYVGTVVADNIIGVVPVTDRKYSTTLTHTGNDLESLYLITHNFNTLDLIVQVYQIYNNDTPDMYTEIVLTSVVNKITDGVGTTLISIHNTENAIYKVVIMQ